VLDLIEECDLAPCQVALVQFVMAMGTWPLRLGSLRHGGACNQL